MFGLAFGIDSARGPQTLNLRWPHRPEWRPLLSRLVVWLIDELAKGLVVGAATGPVFGVIGLSALLSGLLDLWSAPLAISHAVGPLKVYRADRRRTLVVGLVFGVTAGLLAPGSAMRLGMAQVRWVVRGRPVRFMPLLETALKRQMPRQAGSVYQFRHAALQDYLARPSHHRVRGPPPAQ